MTLLHYVALSHYPVFIEDSNSARDMRCLYRRNKLDELCFKHGEIKMPNKPKTDVRIALKRTASDKHSFFPTAENLHAALDVR